MKRIYILLLLLGSQMAIAFPTVTEINPTIDSLMNLVNMDSLEAKIRYLQNLGPRPRIDTGFYAEAHQNNIAAKNWLYQQYLNIGNLDVYYHHFLPEELCGSSYSLAMNVVAVQIGTEYPDEYIVVCGHFDTYYNIEPWQKTPGADDNASGTSGVVEIARILSKHKFKRSIIYLNTNGEESGGVFGSHPIFGSQIFAHNSRQNNINILGVFNLDMLGYNPIGKPLEIFYNDRPPLNKEFAKYFDEVANLYLPEIPAFPNQIESTWGNWGTWGEDGLGDCSMFLTYNYPAMYIGDPLRVKTMVDEYFNPCYHLLCDTIGIGKADAGVNSMELVQGYTQAALVAIAELAELVEISIKEENSISCVISPNPTNATVTITLYFNDFGNLTIALNNVLGQEVMKVYDGFADTRIFAKNLSLSHLPQGVYYLKITHNENIKVEKIVVN